MKDRVSTEQGKKSLKDIILGTPRGTPRTKRQTALLLLSVVLLVCALGLLIADWGTGSTSRLLGLAPWPLMALAYALEAFESDQASPSKPLYLVAAAMMLLLTIFALISPDRQWP